MDGLLVVTVALLGLVLFDVLAAGLGDDSRDGFAARCQEPHERTR